MTGFFEITAAVRNIVHYTSTYSTYTYTIVSNILASHHIGVLSIYISTKSILYIYFFFKFIIIPVCILS